jgi:hypothetical protein
VRALCQSDIGVSAKVEHVAQSSIICLTVIHALGTVVRVLIYLLFHIGEKVYIKGKGLQQYTITGYLGDNHRYVLDNNIVVTDDEISRTPTIDVPLDRLNRLLDTTVEPDPTGTKVYNQIDGVETVVKVPTDRLNRILNTTVEPDPQSTIVYKKVHQRSK